jgi:hypothetical protein
MKLDPSISCLFSSYLGLDFFGPEEAVGVYHIFPHSYFKIVISDSVLARREKVITIIKYESENGG